MEDYRRAYLERLEDKDKLIAHDRRLAAMHLGGVAIECLLKALLVEVEGVSAWHVSSDKCPSCGVAIRPSYPQSHGVANPGHDLMRAITASSRLKNRLMSHPQRQMLVDWINEIMKPSCNFIALRYECNPPDDSKFQAWKDAFGRLHFWLCRQDQDLRVRR